MSFKLHKGIQFGIYISCFQNKCDIVEEPNSSSKSYTYYSAFPSHYFLCNNCSCQTHKTQHCQGTTNVTIK